MKTDDFVSYDLAQRLKEVEFKEHCKNAYLKIGRKVKLLYWGTAAKLANDMGGEYVSAPTLWHAQKWLREKHHISVRVSYLAYHKVWFADWLNLDSGEFDDTDATFATYEEALADGISVALELIEQENK